MLETCDIYFEDSLHDRRVFPGCILLCVTQGYSLTVIVLMLTCVQKMIGIMSRRLRTYCI